MRPWDGIGILHVRGVYDTTDIVETIKPENITVRNLVGFIMIVRHKQAISVIIRLRLVPNVSA